MKLNMLLMLILFTIAIVACGSESISVPESLLATSPAYKAREAIPQKYTCQGEDLSPAFSWKGVPTGTESWAIIFDDPDAPGGTWVHWILYNIPPEVTAIPENASRTGKLPAGTLEGKNSWGKTSYGGPCPPPGKAHRYFFKVYALDTMLTLDQGADKTALIAAMKDHAIAMGSFYGTYKKK